MHTIESTIPADTPDYSLFIRFIDTFSKDGFSEIDPDHPLMLELEEMMERNNQFFYIADVIQLSILFTSKRSVKMIGIEPEELTFYQFMELTHPDDIQRLNIGRPKIMKLAQDLFTAKSGSMLLSTDFRMRNTQGDYSDILIQCYLVYATIPRSTVFFLKVHTNIDWWQKKQHGFHYYMGEDMSYFKYPDRELLDTGMLVSHREFEILKLVEQGMSSEQIAHTLFLSLNTVNTHRSNMLKKTGKDSISDLIYSYKERGLL